MSGIKFDLGKNKWDLLDFRQIEKIVEILTIGADKYSKDNWKNVQPFKSRYFAALLRHLIAYKNGEKYDAETGKSHLSHAATNLHFLMWGEDHIWNMENLRIAFDIDGVLADFNTAVANKYNIKPENGWWKYSYKFDSDEIWKDIDSDKDFWLNLKPLCSPKDFPIEPYCYITARIHPKWTMEWLELSGFATRPLINVSGSKIDILKQNKIDVFIDDKYEHYKEAKKIGVKSFLMDQPWNRRYDVGIDRIFNIKDLKNKL